MQIAEYIPPAPQPAVEQRVRRELKRLEPLLDILWQPGWIWNPAQKRLEGRYVLVSWWPDADPRHRDPDCSPDGKRYDIIGAFCEDVLVPKSLPQDPERVLQLVFELLGSIDGNRIPHMERIRKVQEENRKHQEVVRLGLEEEMHEAAERAAYQVFGKELF